MPTADGQLYADEFIGEVIGIARLRHLNLDMSSDDLVLAHAGFEIAESRDGNHYDTRHFVGIGKTMGFALAALREKIREHYGR